MIVKAQRDFYTGLLFTAVGLFFVIFGQGLERGTVDSMGPGYLPLAVSFMLIAIGLVQLVRGFVSVGESVSFKFKEPAVMVVALVAFGYFLPKVGTLVSVLGLMLASAALHKKFTWKMFAVSYTVIVALVLIFKYGLGSSIPL
jgi:hypothetical protein